MSRTAALATPLRPVTAMYVDTGLGYVLIEAAITDPFGIHRDANGEGYSVSHIATGYKLAEGFATIDAALALCNELRRMKKINWGFTDKAIRHARGSADYGATWTCALVNDMRCIPQQGAME
ncbi:hypothetical protein VWT76_15860 [Xanthomonas citri pv. citri]|uniref:hypothetical protein n=1 Tax=Xanthomonas TaxID=338 RepID=UPI000952BEC1|nr:MULTISPECIES: hypothetical protein [Xanthomonas]MBD5034972.1 hypothetical protein [Xanthomonas citri pv. citri]MBD5054744.1 hypothetical protein [Xanthomonas citri pv. citri]MCC8630250.1 hypothetical protein [Xanthomonas vesicatoria]OLR69706.1 hypothetical protein BI311_23610 [Xanthomonas citri pv. citri]